MTRITRCSKCGEYVSEIWKKREVCPSCQGDLERFDISVPMDRIPRIMNIFGIASMILTGALFIYFLSGDGLSGGPYILLISIAALSTAFFLISLIFQHRVQSSAWKEKDRISGMRKKKRLRSPDDPRSDLRKGRVERSGPVTKRAKKIPVKE